MSQPTNTQRERDTVWMILAAVACVIGFCCGAMWTESRVEKQATESRR